MNRTLCLIVITALKIYSIDYYVSPSGSDANPGTKAAPFATIIKARDVVRPLTATMTDTIHIYLTSGWYFITSTLMFDNRDNGTTRYPVVYQAVPGEYPVISGGKQITGWTLFNAQKNIWRAPAPAITTRQLFVNCKRAVRAHSGFGLPGASAPNATGYTTTDTSMKNWRNPSDIEFVFNGRQLWEKYSTGNPNWTERRCAVQSISGTTITMKQPGWNTCKTAGNGQAITTGPSDIENAYELLDLPGEWYLDRAGAMIYYIPLPFEDIASATTIVPILETLMNVTGTLAAPVQNLQFIGITFAHATMLRAGGTAAWPENQANYLYGSPSRVPGNIIVSAARNIRFEQCVFKHLGGIGLDLAGGTHATSIVGCAFSDISGTNIQIGSEQDPTRSDIRTRDDSIRVINCYIHNGPVEYRGGCPIQAAYVSNLGITHNTVSTCPYTSISLGWGWGRTSFAANNTVSYNLVHNAMSQLGDGGGLYTLSPQPGTRLHHNYLYDIFANSIYPDQGSSHLEFHHNVIKLRPGMEWIHMNNMSNDLVDNSIHDNFADADKSFMQGQYTASNNQIVTNGIWPQTARDIMDSAGIEPAWQNVLTMPCGCSLCPLLSSIKPLLVTASRASDIIVRVQFSTTLDKSSAETASNYAISNGIAVTRAYLDPLDPHYVLLATSRMSDVQTYTLTVSNVRDQTPSHQTIAPNSSVVLTSLGTALVAWYKFDELTGGTVKDYTQNRFDGKITGTDTTWVQGKVGNGLRFNGKTTQVILPKAALGQITTAGDYTMALWVRPDNISQQLMQIFNSNYNRSWMNISGVPFNTFIVKASSGGLSYRIKMDEDIQLEAWNHIAIGRKDTVGFIYFNGFFIGLFPSDKFVSTEELWLGGLKGGANPLFTGIMDDVRLYARALSEADIRSLAEGYAGPESLAVSVQPFVHKAIKTAVISFSIYDCQGKFIVGQKNGAGCPVNRKITLPSGIYILNVKYSSMSETRKIVAQRPGQVISVKQLLSY